MRRDDLHCAFFMGGQAYGLEDRSEAAFADFMQHLVFFVDVALLDLDDVLLIQKDRLEDLTFLS